MAMAPGGNGRANINITPMIDVLLVLIIIFMVISPLKQVGFATTVPDPAPERPREPRLEDIIVTVHKDGTLLLNQQQVDVSVLPDRFFEIYQARGDAVLFVRGDGELQFARIAEVIHMANGAGLRRIALLTSNPT